jgi:hypothetical protein
LIPRLPRTWPAFAAGLVLALSAACGVDPEGGTALDADTDALECVPTTGPLPILAVQASANDGNVPANVLDGSTSTRWSCYGKGCWIRADLGGTKQVNGVDIAWYSGASRTNSFDVSVSADGVAYTKVFSGKSALTASLQRTTFPTTAGRYVRITVYGNTVNDWASITELRVLGVIPCPTTTDPGTGGTGGTTAPSPTGTDRFGVTMLYPTKSGGEEWYLGEDPTRDPRFNPQATLARNADGSFKNKSSAVRMLVYTSTGYDTSKIKTYNRDQLTAQGYMQAPNDWKNVELTGFVKLNAATDPTDNFTWYARGGRHTDSLACEGSAYKGDLYYDGRARWAKESWHVSYDYTAYKTATTSIKGRWVGWKAVIRNVVVNGKTAVKMESYLNDNADKVTWKKVYEWLDDGAWAGDEAHCGAANTRIAQTWGGPTATFRWDSATDVDFKWLSVREIQP